MKKLTAILCALVLLLSCTLTACAAEPKTYADTDMTQWYAEGVQYVTEKGIMSGVGNDRFAPDTAVTRAMFVTILYRMEGSPELEGTHAFRDVKPGSYYEKPVIWAAVNQIVTGYSETAFGPDDSITREQFATILYRYAKWKGQDVSQTADLSTFADSGAVSAYAVDAMGWANAKGLINGTGANLLSPRGQTTRAQAAVIIRRFLEPSLAETPSTPDASAASSGGTTPAAPVAHEKSTQPTLRVDSVTAKAGEQVTVNVNVENNPGILGMTLTISYDENALTLLSAENGTAVRDVLTFVPSKALKNGSSFVWYGTELAPQQVQDGAVMTLTFAVKEGTSDICPITLTSMDGDIIGADLQSLTLALCHGAVAVSG